MNNYCDKCNLDSCQKTWVVFRKDCVWTDWLNSEEECIGHIHLAVINDGFNESEFSYKEINVCDLENMIIYYDKYNREE